MGKADPLSLLILVLVSGAALLGSLSLRNNIVMDLAQQEGLYANPADLPDPFAYPGAETPADLGRDICGHLTWFSALIPDFVLFTHTVQGGDPADLLSQLEGPVRGLPGDEPLPLMEYCRVHSASLEDCDAAFAASTGRLAGEDMTAQAMREAQSLLGVQGCAVLRVSMTLSIGGQTKTFHHVVAGLVQDRWRVLLFLP